MSITEDIAKIKQQEAGLQFAQFTEDQAWALGCQMRDAAAAELLPLVIDIRIGQRQMFYTALSGSVTDNAEWVRRKANSVLRFHKSTYLLGREVVQSGRALDRSRGVDEMNYVTAGGGFPIHIIGVGVIGAITVSGVPQRDDHGFVVAQLCRFLGKDANALALGPE